MKKLLVVTLLAVAAAAHAQSYDDRAAAQQAAQAIQAYDDMKMAEARSKLRSEQAARERELSQDRDHPLDWQSWAILAALAGVGYAAYATNRDKKKWQETKK